ncbi:MAG: ABC transporter substrate-binding protein [Chloroflexota bacterium]
MGASGSDPSDRPGPRDLDPSRSPGTPVGESPQESAPGPIEEVLAEPEVKAPAEAELRTFLIADIRGYTVYTTEHGADAAADLATRFAAIVREVVTANDGFLIELRGDEALAVFVLARRALRTALELQIRFGAELPRGVGIGLDAGEAIPVEGGYRGSALNLAARLCGQAGPSETLASEAVIHLAAKVDGIGYADPRTYRLKGMDEPIRAVHVVSADKASKGPIRYGHDGGPDRRLLVAGAVGLLAVALIAVVASGAFRTVNGPTGSDGGAAASTSAAPSSSPELFGVDELPLVAYVDPATGTVSDTRRTDSTTVEGAFVDGSLWLASVGPWAMHRVDPQTHEMLQTVPFPVANPGGTAIDGGTLWVNDSTAPRVIGVDVATGLQVHEYWLTKDHDDGSIAVSLVAAAGSLWVGVQPASEIVRLDPSTGRVQATIKIEWPDVLASDGSAVYSTGGGRLHRIDPSTNSITWATPIMDTYLPTIGFGGGFIWTAEDTTGTVWKVDPTGRLAGTYQVGIGARPLAALGDTMWVGVQDAGTLVGVDMVTGATKKIQLGHQIGDLVATQDELVATLEETPEEIVAGVKGDVLTIATPYAPFLAPVPDPATNGSFEFRQAGFLTCAGLLRYPSKPAPDGWVLEPEVAAAMPEVSPDGRTYTFKVRDGFKFSPPSNESVTAETYRATIERSLSANLSDSGRGIVFLSDIVGAVPFHDGHADHVSGIAASGDTLTIRLTKPAPDFLRRLTLPYFCPLPIGTPTVPGGLDPTPPLPAAGPYYLAQHRPGELGLFLPNPNYSGDRKRPWSAIAFRFGYQPGEAIRRVEDGLADATTADAFEPLLNAASDRAKAWGPGSAAAGAVDQRWFGGPRFYTEFIALNGADPLLRDPSVRRAIALALDRPALAALLGQAPATSLLPPSVPGGPPVGAPLPTQDLNMARSLMAGRTGTLRIEVLPVNANCAFCDAVANALASQLVPIGITVKVERVEDPEASVQDPKSKVGLFDGWLDTDYPDPLALLGGIRARAWLPKADFTELDRIDGLDGQERVDAAIAFAARVTDQEGWVVPIGYPVYPLYLSDKVGCGYVQPAIGAVDLLSLCRKP